MPALSFNIVCTRLLRPSVVHPLLSHARLPAPALSLCIYVRSCTESRHVCRPRRPRTCSCQSHKGLDGDTSVSIDARSGSRAVGHRQALFHDFTLTEPFGIVNIVAGIIGLLFKGGWLSFLIIICGVTLFTLGSMSHHNAVEGVESSWTLTLLSAAVCGLLARKYYQKAIVGVAGTMVMTIVSALTSLACVYNVVAGGNKPLSNKAQSGTSRTSPRTAPTASSPPERLSDPHRGSFTASQVEDSTAENDSMQQPAASQTGSLQSGTSPWGANAYTVVSVTGAVLYAQGLWGLWGEIVGYSPAGLAAAAASGLAILGVARALVQQSAARQEEDVQ